MTNEAGEGAPLSAERETDIRARFAELDEPDDLQRLASEFAEGKTSRAMAYFVLAWEDYRDLLAEIDRLRAALTASERDRQGLANQLSSLFADANTFRTERDAARAQLAAQQAETARLQAALLAIDSDEDRHMSVLEWVTWAQRTAERALLSGGAEEASDAATR